MSYFGQNVPGWVQPSQPMSPTNQPPQPAPYNQPTMPVPQPQPQTQQPGPLLTGFRGRYVDDISEVMPNEVPMDGNIAIFPTRDANTVYLKVWNRAGNLLTVRYVLDQNQQQEDPMQQVYDRLSRLEEALTKSKKPTGNKKEAES